MKIIIALSVLCLLDSVPAASAENDKRTFKLFLCDVAADPSAVLVFRNEEGRARRVAFMESYKEFAITMPDSKGLLSWDKVIAVRVLPTAVPGMAGHMRIEYRQQDRTESLELGSIDEPCLTALKKRYGTQLNFQPS